MNHSKRLCAALTAMIVACLSLPTNAAGDTEITYRTLLLSRTDGPLGPGLGEGVQFGADIGGFHPQTFDTPVIDQLGNVVFTGRVLGTGISGANDTGIWIITPDDQRTMTFREGEPVPGLAGPVFGNFWASSQSNPSGYIPAVVSNGRVAARTIFTGDGVDSTNDQGVMVSDGSDVRLVVREGQLTPVGPAGTFFRSIRIASPLFERTHPLRINDRGVVQFGADVRTPSGQTLDGLWQQDRTSSLTTIIFEDDPTPGLPGTDVNSVSRRHALAPDGSGAVSANWDGPSFGDAVFRMFGGTTELIVKRGDALPGLPGSSFYSFDVMSINDAGHVLYFAETTVDGEHTGYWRWSEGRVLPLIQEGMPSPVDGQIVPPTLGYANMNSEGEVVYQIGLSNGSIYKFDGTDHALIASPESIATTFGIPGDLLGEAVINGRGQVAFGQIRQASSEIRYEALFATDLRNSVCLVVQSGDLFEFAPEDVRTVDWCSFSVDSGGADGQRMSFNDRGELVFKVVFADGSGAIVVATIDPPTCPGDLSDDGEIDVDDLNLVLSAWNTSVPPGTSGDADGSGVVDVEDLNIVLSAWGSGCE